MGSSGNFPPNPPGGPPYEPHSNEPDDRPVAHLLDLEHETSPEFLSLVRNRIHRRITTGQVGSLLWNLPQGILLEFLLALQGAMELLNPKPGGGAGSGGNGTGGKLLRPNGRPPAQYPEG